MKKNKTNILILGSLIGMCFLYNSCDSNMNERHSNAANDTISVDSTMTGYGMDSTYTTKDGVVVNTIPYKNV